MKSLTLLCPLIFLFYSCTKNDSPDTPDITNKLANKVKTVRINDNFSSSGPVILDQYYYNDNGTLNYETHQIEGSPSLDRKTTFTYPSGMIVSLDSLGNTLMIKTTYFLVPNNMVDSSVSITYDQNEYVLATKYGYNSAGQLTSGKIYNYSVSPDPDTITYEYLSGNVVKFKSDINSSFYSAYSYLDKKNNLTASSFGLPFLTVSNFNTNLVNEVRTKDESNPATDILTSYYEYTVDSNNRVETVIAHMTDNGIDNGKYIKYVYSYY